MKIIFEQLKDSQLALVKLSKFKLPVKTAYWISRLINKVNSEIKEGEKERFELIKKFGELTNKKTNSWTVTEEHLIEYQEAITKRDEKELDFDFEPIKLSSLGEIPIEPEALPSWAFVE